MNLSICLFSFHFIVVQGTDIHIVEAPPPLVAYAHLRGVWLRPVCVTLYMYKMHYY